ncbi:sigma-54 dependent transcriptional regulator [soil metagenome]
MANVLLLYDIDSSKINDNQSLAFCEVLEKLGHKVYEAASLVEALKALRSDTIEIIFIDQPGSMAVRSLTAIKGEGSLAAVPTVVLSLSKDDGEKNDNVIEAMRMGATDHMVKPTINQVKVVIDRAIATSSMASNYHLPDQLVLGQSAVMRQVQKLIGMAASCEATVLILGETGTGKDRVAREIHKHSQQSTIPLTVVDCTAVPEDYQSFRALSEGAHGTVILDEIGDLNSQTQAMLVRALKEANGVRIVATTQYDLVEMVKERRFREDLYYRLNVLPIVLPPLNKRGSDILALAELFLQQAQPNSPKQLSSSAAKLLLDYPWPGNVRELQNLMYHLSFTVRSETIEVEDLEIESNTRNTTLDYYSTMADVEKRLLEQALESANGSRTEAARLLGINRQLLYSKLKAHGLMKP